MKGLKWHSEETIVSLTTLAAALLIASNQVIKTGFCDVLGNYFYWVVRIFIEAFMFFGARQILALYIPRSFSKLQLVALSILFSLVPFVLAVTAIDIVLGYPELGIGSETDSSVSRLGAFVWELVFLLDNHIALCALVSIPSWIFAIKYAAASSSDEKETQIKSGSLLAVLDPPLSGAVILMEAQEHYVRVVTTDETRMVLSRFSDLVREMPENSGLQVHRSHWVGFSEIQGFFKEGQSSALRLKTGEIVPVSRSFHNSVKSHLETLTVQ